MGVKKCLKSKMVVMFLALLITLPLVGGYARPAIAAPPLPRALWFGTNPPGSLYYVLGGGIAKVLSQRTPMEIKVKPLGGPAEWMALMANKEVDLAIVNASAGRMGYEGLREFKEATKGKGYRFLRTIVAGGPLRLGIVAAADTDIKTMSDLKGKKVSYPFKVHVVNSFFLEIMFASAGLTPKDIVHVPVTTYPKGVRTVADRRSDVALGSVGSGVIKELQAARGARFIPIQTTPEAIKRMQEMEPATMVLYPGPPITGFEKKTPCIGFANLVVARETLSGDAVYVITKALWENYKELFPIHPSFKAWNSKNFATTGGITIPYHPGAIRFYKEKGVWTDKMEKLQGRLLAK